MPKSKRARELYMHSIAIMHLYLAAFHLIFYTITFRSRPVTWHRNFSESFLIPFHAPNYHKTVVIGKNKGRGSRSAGDQRAKQ